MLLKMTAGLSGPLFNLGPGDEHEFEAAEADRLIEAGFATPVTAEKTERSADETGAERRGKRGKNVVSDEGDNAGDK